MSDPYIGEIRLFAGNYAPYGWAFCDGSTLSISSYETLFSLIGTTYGGDGQTTFKLPDLRGRIAMHQGIGSGASYPLGQTGGSESATLSTSQIPSHTHSIAADNTGSSVGTATGNFFGPAGILHYGAASGVTTGPVLSGGGSSQPHDNRMPYLTASYIISLFGIYPTTN